MSQRSEAKWLLLIHQIPPKPDYFRVKIGRRLQRLGAAPIKNSVYVLPRSEQAYEDFEWVVREIVEGGGDASVCEARFVEGLSDVEVEGLFNAAREADYFELADEARRVQPVLSRSKKTEDSKEELESSIARLRKRLAEIENIDFFAANGRDTVEALLVTLEKRMKAAATQASEEGDAPRRARGSFAASSTKRRASNSFPAKAIALKPASFASTCSRRNSPTKATGAPSKSCCTGLA